MVDPPKIELNYWGNIVLNKSFSPGEIPTGITFGDKVALIPALSFIFSHSGHLTNDLYRHKSYTWIKRGDPIGEYRISTPKVDIPIIKFFLTEDEHKVIVRSPVSGLIIFPFYDYGAEDYDYNVSESSPPLRMTILLPDDEPPAEDGHYLSSDICRVCWEHRHFFLKPSRYWSMAGYEENELKEFLDKQKKYLCKYYNAMPHFEKYFQEARTRYPQLRPFLKHLL